MANPLPAVVVAGQPAQSGAYILHIAVAQPLWLRFGAAAGGAHVRVPAGDYVYVGSAMGRRGPACLGSRLLRHAARSGGCPPHAIHRELAATFQECGLSGHPPRRKTLHWHVDYLLDSPAAALVQVCALRTTRRLERELAASVEAGGATRPVVAGLGASDHRGHTHLLRVTVSGDWWQGLGAAALVLAEAHTAAVHPT